MKQLNITSAYQRSWGALGRAKSVNSINSKDTAPTAPPTAKSHETRDAGAAASLRDQFCTNTTPAMQEPLLDSTSRAGASQMQPHHSATVECSRVKGTLTVGSTDGSIQFTALEENRTVAWCSLCRTNPDAQISGAHVVGAALDSPNSFRVWYCTPAKPILSTSSGSSSNSKAGTGNSSSSSSGHPPKFKLHKTLPFACATGTEASALVQLVRQAAAWHGRATPPRVVAIINPKSGQGRAEKVFEQQVLPVLQDAAGMSVHTLVTAGPGAATQMAAQLDLSAVDLLLFVGGDGTVYEGLQGLLSRPDWDAARRIPIAHVPGGSGNGLAHSCGLRDAATAAFSICKGVFSPMDVASVLQPPASRQYIMLSVAYGSLANLDINTERFRWLGDLRFTLGAIWEVLQGKSYAANIAWLPAADDIQQQQQAASNGYGNSKQQQANSNSVVIDSTALLSAAGSSSSASSSSAPGQLPVSSTRMLAAPPDHQPGASLSLQDFPQQGPDLPLLQQLGRLPLSIPTQPDAGSLLPPGWKVWHDPLQLFAVINPPYIAANSKMNPRGALHTGHFNMLLYEGMPGFMGRVHALSFLAKAETGSHLDTPSLIQDKVRAMIFDPRKDYGTYLELDGEMIPHVPIYMEVHPGLLQVVVSPAHPTEPAADHSRQQFEQVPKK